MINAPRAPYFILIFFVAANFVFWTSSQHKQKDWLNVPEAPESHRVGMMTLGDNQLAYRYNGLMLQNFGSVDGRFVSLKEYNYDHLKSWFFLQDNLDPVSNFIPMLAAYYYGAVGNNEKLDKVLDYLAVVGQRPYGEKWRWLGHAVYLARHQQKDNDRALELSYLLAANEDPDLADWAKQMPVFVLQAKGEKELAYEVMLGILVSNVDKMHPNEIFYMKDHICHYLLPDLPDVEEPPFCEK